MPTGPRKEPYERVLPIVKTMPVPERQAWIVALYASLYGLGPAGKKAADDATHLASQQRRKHEPRD